MSILITGGTGIIGSCVAVELAKEGHRPLLYDRRLDRTFLGDVQDQVEVIQGDVLDLDQLVRIIRAQQVRTIIHLAAVIIPEAQADPYKGFQVNAGGTVTVLEAARIEGCRRVIYTSSRSVYGPVAGEHGHPTYRPLPEEHPKAPRSVYGVTKLAGELMAREFSQRYGLQVICLRFPALYGPGRLARHGEVALHSRLIEGAMAGVEVVVPRGAEQRDDLLYVRDAARAVALGAAAEGITSFDFNVGSETMVTLRELVAILEGLYPKARLRVGPGLDPVGLGYIQYCRYDCARARKELGYRPQYSLDAGVRDYVETMARLGLQPLAELSAGGGAAGPALGAGGS
ncbi:MAG: NAD(P)-dependent oxidoreductase [Deltaproteobacteria bacterium]|nr:NAD(P)-dependent oxidoreductase [Deltaproteobacteria bacterium]